MANRPNAKSKRSHTGKSIHMSSSFSNTPKDQSGVLAAQTVYAGDADIDGCAARFGGGVEAKAVDGFAGIDGRGDGVVMERQNGGGGIDATAGGEVAGLRFDRSEGNFFQR